MNKKFTILTAALALLTILAVPIGMWGQTRAEEVYKQTIFSAANNSQNTNSYTNSWYNTTDGFRNDLTNANNNNNGWSGHIKMGSKSSALTGTIITNAAIDKAITKVALTIDAITVSKITSISLYTSSNGTTWGDAVGTFDKSTGTKEVTISSPTEELYYKIEVVCGTGGSSNGFIEISKVEYYYNTGGASAPSITADNVDIDYNDDEGYITYTVNNPVTGGAITASEDSDWIEVETNPGATGFYFVCGDNTNGGERSATVTLTYTYNTTETVTKDVTVTQAAGPNAPGTSGHPYTVAQARAAIDAGTGVTGVYATGIVSTAATSLNSDGSLSYYISDDGTNTTELEAYKGKGISGADFTSTDDIKVGDVVVITGDLTKYGSIYEFASGNQLVSLVREPSITASNLNITCSATSGSIPYTINNPVEGGILSCSVEGGLSSWITSTTVESDAVTFVCSANTDAERTETITLTYTYNATETVTKDVTVTQAEYVAMYMINFGLDGGTFVPNADFATINEEKPAGTYNLPSATKVGWEFTGWNDGTTTYDAGAEYTVSDDVGFTAQWTKITTGTINFGSAAGSTAINNANVSGTDNMGYTWSITTAGTSSFTQNSAYSQVGSSSSPATSITFTTTLASSATLSAFSAKFGGFGSTAGTITLKVGDVTVGTGSLNGTDDVVVENTSIAVGTVLTVTVTGISKGVKCYYISYTPTTDPVITAADVDLAYSATSGEIAYTISNPDGSTLVAAEKAPGYDWIDAVTVVGAENKVTFTTTANAGASREGYITLTYGSVTKDVKVTQAGPTYTVTYAANGGTGEMTDTNSPYEVGVEVTLLANTFTAPEGKLWGGWQVTDALDNDIPVTGGKFTMPASNVTVTAIWRGTATYSLVTSVEGLVSGKHYVIASGTDGTVKAMGLQNANNRAAVSTAVNESVLAEVEGVFEFVISGDGTNKYTIYDETNGGYLFAAGGGNYLRNQPTIGSSGQWEISFSGDAAVITTNSGDKIMRYNSGNNIFSCYASGQAAIYLYKKVGETDYNFYSNTTLASATIAADETYTVHSGATLNVTTSLSNAATSNAWEHLVIKDGAQLKTPNAVNGTIEKAITGYSSYSGSGVGGYYLLATPASMDACNNTGMWPTTGDNHEAIQADIDFYSFDQSADQEWQNFKHGNPSFAGPYLMQQGQGYLYANPNDVTLTLQTRGYESSTTPYQAHPFAATNEPIAVPMSYYDSKPLAGYNLLGNPFTCDAYINREYYRMNDAGDAVIAAASATTAIKPCEGIFVLAADGDDNSVTFSTTVPSGAAPANVVINLKESEMVRDRAIVSFGNERNMPRFQFNEAAAKLYIPQGEKEMAKVNSEAQGEMPVNFKADKNGSYTLSIDIEADMDYLHLIDNMTGADVDLLANPSYTFDARTSDYASRFRLLFSANDENGASTGSATFAYFNGSEWVVNSNGNATLQVVDVMGRVLSSETVNGNHTMNLNLSTGVYMLRLVNGNDVKTQKIVVR